MSRVWKTVLLASICLSGSLLAGQSAPWGELAISPMVIAPPIEYVPVETEPVKAARWHFPGLTPEALGEFLTEAGLSPPAVSRMMGLAQPEPSTTGLVVEPGGELIRALTPDVRAMIYRRLAKSPLNYDQASAYYFNAGSIDTWLGGPEVTSPGLRAIVDPLIYRIGDFLYLADIKEVLSEVGPGPEFQTLVRRLLRQQSIFVTLSVSTEDDVERLEEYWGRGGRRTDIRPLLESVMGDGQSLRISELLPDLPRRLLYRFPKVRAIDLEKPQLANCFWTALNFFNDTPDDRFLDVRVAMDTLKSDYFLVHGHQQLGDIVVLSTNAMNVFHVAVYLADDLVFTKNGSFSLAPWIIMPLDRLKGPYAGKIDDWKVTYYRRKDL